MPTQTKTTVPSAHDVLVPETLLKKRRDDAKSREEKQAKIAEARKVGAVGEERGRTKLAARRIQELGGDTVLGH